MYNKLIVGVCALLLSATFVIHVPPLSAKNTVSSKISSQEMEMIKQVTETVSALQQDKTGGVWPGYDLSTSPMVLTFNNGHLYAFNLKHPDSDWQQLSIGNTTVFFSDHDHWNIGGIHMHPEFPIDDEKAFVFHFDMMQADPYLPFLVLVHERFHQHQFQHFAHDETTYKDGYKDHLNADNLALMQLEELILVDYLRIQGTSNADTQNKMDVLKQFLAVHQARRAVMQPSSIHWEQLQQSMEGLADYVSAKMYDVNRILPGFYGEVHLLHIVQGYADDESISDRAIKWRHYGVGATIGFALDNLKVKGWKQQVQEHNVALDDLLAKALTLSDSEASQLVQKAKQKYVFKSIREKVVTQLTAYQNELASHLNNYQGIEGICVKLGRPNISTSGGGSNRHLYYLADGSTLALEESSVNASMDNLWNVTFRDVPFVFQNNSGEREFKVEKDLVVKLDGETFRLKDLVAVGSEKSFSSISWEGRGTNFDSEHYSGKLVVQDGKVSILYSI